MKITNFICGYKKTREQDHQEMDFEKDYFSSLSLDKEPRAQENDQLL